MRVVWFFLFFYLPCIAIAQCNGNQSLCSKRYNEIFYVTTHNAFNAEENGFALPNQTYGLTQQLEDGVRALMIDVYDENGVATVYHGFSFLGTTTLADNLGEIKAFLDANPDEVVTIIFESYVDANLMEDVFTSVGLLSYLYEQTLGEQWPTLQQMIDQGKRLMVFTDAQDAGIGQEWYHYVWDFAVETDFTNNAPSDFSCDFNRGSPSNDLFILNHFVTDANLGTGQADQAAIVNEVSFFYDRVIQCWTEKQKLPNFLTVDFYELGAVMLVADSLNNRDVLSGQKEQVKRDLTVFQTSERGVYTIQLPEKLNQGQLEIRNAIGQLIDMQTIYATTVFELNLKANARGTYYGTLTDAISNHVSTFRLIN